MTDRPQLAELKMGRLRPDELGRLAGVLRANYGPRYYGADGRYMSWLYLESPSEWFEEARRRDQAPVNILTANSGDIVAIHAFVPFDARTPWGGTRGVWDLEWVNSGGPRGAGRRLAAALLAEVDVYAGFGSNKLSLAAFARLGITVIPEVHRLVVVTSAARLRSAMDSMSPSSVWEGLPQSPDVVEQVAFCEAAGAISTAALERYEMDTPFGVSRRRTWLRWRYDRHPYLRYAVLQNEEGAAVVRIEVAAPSGLPACRVLEFLPIGASAPRMARAIAAFAQRERCGFVDYFSSSEDHIGTFFNSCREAGLSPLRNPAIPFMTQPLQFGASNAFNMVIAAGGAAPQALADSSFASFHASKGDANQDVSRLGWTSDVG
jgi:hypothetical protein